MKVAIVGGGVGGLAAATRLAILGHRVQIFEAREDVGGSRMGVRETRPRYRRAATSTDGGFLRSRPSPGLRPPSPAGRGPG
ncbi:MAG: hypothetical protein DMF59_20450 [Acidobacteria bacterium]|nr:MAG: hypothetical protein DMF59_20450 [Acidobacteriota bacterium]